MAWVFRHILLPALLVVSAVPLALAKDLGELDVRAVEQSSTDVFDVLSQFMQAESAYKSGDYKAALAAYRYVYLHDRNQDEAALGYANSALALGQVDIAQTLYRQLTSEEARNGEVLCAVIKSETDHPEAALRHRLKTSPNDGRLWNMLGRVLDEAARHKDAREAYVMAGMAGQRAGITENNLGLSFLREGRRPQALEHFQRAVLQAPADVKFDNNRRLALLLEKKYAPALQALDGERASQILSDAGVIAAAQDDTKLAFLLFEKANQLSPVYNARIEHYLAKLKH